MKLITPGEENANRVYDDNILDECRFVMYQCGIISLGNEEKWDYCANHYMNVTHYRLNWFIIVKITDHGGGECLVDVLCIGRFILNNKVNEMRLTGESMTLCYVWL